MNYIDLFAGTCAFSLVLNKLDNYKCVFANDLLKSSNDIYKLNINDEHFVLQDLLEINVNNIPKHDLLCAGFPCQPFSICGKQEGFNDKRSNVFWKIIDILNYHKPNIVILENVKNLKSHDKGNTYKIIKNSLTNIGYYVTSSILDTSKYTDIPHHRERIYIICIKNIDINKNLIKSFNFDFPIIKNKDIKYFLENNVNKKYYYTEKYKVYNDIKNNVVKHINQNVIYQYRRHYVRENKSNKCPTLTCNMGSGGHNVPLLLDDFGIRKLTPRECFNLQGFPKDYKFPDKMSDNELYKLVGNAVSLPIIKLIINKINKHI